MAISFVSASTVAIGGTSSISMPSGYAAGDLLVLIVTGASSGVVFAGAPWFSVFSGTIGAGSNSIVYYKTAANTNEPVPGVVLTTYAKAVILAYRGAGVVEAISTVLTGSGTSAVSSSFNTTIPNDYVISMYVNPALGGSVTTWTAPSGTTQRVNSGPGTGNESGLLVVDELQATAGATNSRIATLSSAASFGVLAIALAPIRDLYWVSSAITTNTWTANTTAQWASVVNGPVGSTPGPNAGDNVHFDQYSQGTCATSGTITCRNLIITDPSSLFTFSGAAGFQIYGNLDISNYSGSMNYSMTGIHSFASQTTGGIRNGSVSTFPLNAPITVNSPQGNILIGDGLTGFTIGSASRTLTLTLGFLNLNASTTLKCSGFLTSGTGTKSLVTNYISSLQIYPTASATSFSVVATGFTSDMHPSSSIWIYPDNSAGGITTVVAGAGFTYSQLILDNSVAAQTWGVTITGANTFEGITFNNGGTAGTMTVTFPNSTTTIGTASIACYGNPSGSIVLQRTGASGTFTLAKKIWTGWARDFGDGSGYSVTISNCTATPINTWYGGPYLTDGGGNTGLTFGAAPTGLNWYWVGGSGNLTTAYSGNSFHWSSTSGGTGGNTWPTAYDSAVFDSGSSSGAFQVNCLNDMYTNAPQIGNLVINPTQQLTLNIPSGNNIATYGNLIFPSSNFSTAGSGNILVTCGGTALLPTTAALLTNNIPISWGLTALPTGTPGALVIPQNLTVNNYFFIQTNGNPNNTYTYGSSITCGAALLGSLIVDPATPANGLDLGGGTLTVTNTDNNSLLPEAFKSYINIVNGSVILQNDSTAATQTVWAWANILMGNISIRGGGINSTTKFLGNATLNTLSSTKNTAHTITFGANATTTLSNFTVTGHPNQIVTINSTDPGWRFNLKKV